jgi:hypothetical protein
MSDLFLGQTCTYGASFISAGTAHTFTFPFQVDVVHFYNYTKFGTTSANSVATWFRGMPAGDALIQGVGTAPAGAMLLETTNGFTVADTTGGVPAFRSLISAVTKANPAVVTTTAAHGLQTNQIIRITDLGDQMPTPRGMSELDGKRFMVTVINSTSFSLRDPVSGDPIDSTNYETYVSGGRVDLETRVISLNNPQQPPYNVTPYVPNPFVYLPIEYKLLVGSAVMGSDGDQMYMYAIKLGDYINLGDLLV